MLFETADDLIVAVPHTCRHGHHAPQTVSYSPKKQQRRCGKNTHTSTSDVLPDTYVGKEVVMSGPPARQCTLASIDDLPLVTSIKGPFYFESLLHLASQFVAYETCRLATSAGGFGVLCHFLLA